jgi:hypothetical protein
MLLAWFGWQIVTNALDRPDVRNGGDERASSRETPSALAALAQTRFAEAKEESDLDAADDLAKRALSASPLTQSALRLLGLSADLRGEADRAQSLMELAGERSLHDGVSQVWLLNVSLRANHLEEALAHVDILLRTRVDLYDLLLPAVAAIASDETARAKLVALLESDPPWRSWLLARLPGAAAPTVTFAILTALDAKPGQLRGDEIKPFLDRLVSVGNFELAYLAWQRFFPEARNDPGSLIYNGGFDRIPTNIAFDWILSAVPGAQTDVVESGVSEGDPALRVTFANTRVPYSNTSKLLLLRPGTYTLSGMAHADGLATERGMVWRIYCAEATTQTIAESELMSGTSPWRKFATDFTVPDSKCGAQWLKLELAARAPIEQQVAGEVWYDAITVAARPDVATAN